MSPSVSVVMPARDAQATIGAALRSLAAQTLVAWEAVVVDDGSADATAAVAERHAGSDPRIRVVRQPATGVGAARNAGLALASAAWVLFLDADDWLEPRALELLHAAATGEGRALAGAVCSHARVAVDGRREEVRWTPPEDAFEQLGGACPFAVHACLVRRELVERVGGFDAGLRCGEDWDLWLRLARTGAELVEVPEVLAAYRVRAGSASAYGELMLDGCMRVIERAHAADDRVRDPLARHARGLPRSALPAARLTFGVYCAGLLIGAGRSPARVFERLGPDAEPGLSAGSVAWALFEALPLGRGLLAADCAGVWRERAGEVDALLEELERRSSAGFAARGRRALARLALDAWRGERPLAVGGAYAVELDAERPIDAVRVPPWCDRVHCAIRYGGEPVGACELPAIGGELAAGVLADAIAAEHAWPIVTAFLARRARRELAPDAADGWERFLRELWDEPGLPEAAFYEPDDGTEAGAAPAAPAGGALTVELTSRLPDMTAGSEPLEVELRLAGAPAASVRLAPGIRLSSAGLRAALTASGGFELCRVAVREGLLGRPLDGSSLHERLRAQSAASPDPAAWAERAGAGLVLPRRTSDPPGTSSWRRALLPPGSAAPLRELARGACVERAPGGPVAHVPELAPDRPGRRRAGRLRAWLRRAGERSGAPPEPAAAEPGGFDSVPILMYHRVAEHGAAATRRWRVTPAELDEQLAFLRSHGYRSIGLDDWLSASIRRAPLPGRSLILSFDDGYADFAEHAWPALRRHGFGALVFLVAGRIGARNDWDAHFGEPLPLLDWPTIRELRDQGVQFGSHTATHPRLTGLGHVEAVRELAGARLALERGLESPVRAIAYPYGDQDPIVRHLAGACGHLFGFGIAPRATRFGDGPLDLPRIEVAGGMPLHELATKLGIEAPAPRPATEPAAA